MVKKKKKKLFNFFFKSVRIASYVRKPVKTVKIRKTHVKNVQVDTSAIDITFVINSDSSSTC